MAVELPVLMKSIAQLHLKKLSNKNFYMHKVITAVVETNDITKNQ